MSSAAQLPPPDAVRVWRGFRESTLASADFFARLGAVFIPATVEMQIKAGLEAYLPTIPADLTGKPETVPDETAILFWSSQDTYSQGFERLAVRTYTLTHASVYTPQSGAGFPVPFSGSLELDQPYYLVEDAADWMHGAVIHLVGERNPALSVDAFKSAVSAALDDLQGDQTIAGAIVCLSADYLVYWQLGGSDDLAALDVHCGWSQAFKPAPVELPAGLWEIWPGLTVKSGDSLNVQFTRAWEEVRK